jgi:hypothetical protein
VIRIAATVLLVAAAMLALPATASPPSSPSVAPCVDAITVDGGVCSISGFGE